MAQVAQFIKGGFNSLQTGKWILTKYSCPSFLQSFLFQFPSNGKVDPNEIGGIYGAKWIQSFNSLQTGKWILTSGPGCQRKDGVAVFQFPSNGKVDPNLYLRSDLSMWLLLRFNSLQTGKWILT